MSLYFCHVFRFGATFFRHSVFSLGKSSTFSFDWRFGQKNYLPYLGEFGSGFDEIVKFV